MFSFLKPRQFILTHKGTVTINLVEHPRKPYIPLISVFIDKIKIKGEINMISIIDTQNALCTLGQPVDAKGAPTQIQEGSLVITSSDENVATVERDPVDPFKFKVKGGLPGVCQINYTADADLGEGVVPISGFTGVEVLPGQAAGFGPVVVDGTENQ